MAHLKWRGQESKWNELIPAFSFPSLLITDAEPDGEVYDDKVTTQRNISKLKAEMSKAKWNTTTVTELLKSTFTERRKAMQKFDAGSRIKKTLECYRCLSHQVQVT